VRSGLVRRGLVALVLLLLAVGPVAAADLTVRVEGLPNSRGDVHIALYDNPKAFPDGDGMLREEEVPISAGIAIWTAAGLKPGRYAVAVYHDEDGDDDFDQGIFGIPLERFGFSNGAFVLLGPPSFEAAAFDVAAEGATIVIDLER